MRRVLFLVLVFVGIAGGIAAGILLKPPAGPDAAAKDSGAEGATADGKHTAIPDPVALGPPRDETEVKRRMYVSVGEQTIVPVVDGERTRALMLFELAVDVDPSGHEQAILIEPRLRDAFLRVLLKMSSTGAFTETYTEDWVIDEVRRALGQEARRFLGDALRDVLVLDVIRQEL